MPTKMIPNDSSVRERFWNKVRKGKGCWTWMGGRGHDQYGHFRFKDSGKCRSVQAHRAAWMISHEERIPDGMLVCHRCDNPSCVNPDHLFIGTQKDNMQDCVAKGRYHQKYMKGSSNGYSRIVETQVAALRKHHTEGTLSAKEIAVLLNLSVNHVYGILSGERWGHVND